MNVELLEIVGPALVAGLMIALTHAPLGIEVLKRGIIFIDLAIAQIAGLGLVAAATFFHHPPTWIVQSIALAGTLLAAFGFRVAEKKAPTYLEAIIGVSYILASTLAILLLTKHPHCSESIEHMLSGQMLFIQWSDVLHHLPIYIVIVALWFSSPRVRSGILFYALFSVAITSSVQLAGVYVVFASLIIPALAVTKVKKPHLAAWTHGIISVTVGIFMAVTTDLPAGPLVVISYAFVTLLSLSQRLPQK